MNVNNNNPQYAPSMNNSDFYKHALTLRKGLEDRVLQLDGVKDVSLVTISIPQGNKGEVSLMVVASSNVNAVYLESKKDRQTIHKLKIDFTYSDQVKITKSVPGSNKVAEYVSLSERWENRLLAASEFVEESKIFIVDYSSLISKLTDCLLKFDYQSENYFIEKPDPSSNGLLVTKVTEFGKSKGFTLNLTQFNRLSSDLPLIYQSSDPRSSPYSSELSSQEKGLIKAINDKFLL